MSTLRGVIRSTASSALTRRLVIASVAVAVVTIAVAKLGDDPGVDRQVASPKVARDPTGAAAAPDGLADDVISRVEGIPLPVGEGRQEAPRDEREVAHIGWPLDPESETLDRGDEPPSHIGEYLDPDDEYASGDVGEVSHIGEYLDPLADE